MLLLLANAMNNFVISAFHFKQLTALVNIDIFQVHRYFGDGVNNLPYIYGIF